MSADSSNKDVEYTYTISPGYVKLTIWSFNTVTKRLISTGSRRPFPGFRRENRYKILCEQLRLYGIPEPAYKAKGKV